MGGRRFESRQPTFCGADAVRGDGFWGNVIPGTEKSERIINSKISTSSCRTSVCEVERG